MTTMSWQRPHFALHFAYLKYNFDAKFDVTTDQVNGGWVIRDHEGTSKTWGSSLLKLTTSSLEAVADPLRRKVVQLTLVKSKYIFIMHMNA
ncbi:hypothetical protein AtNW77_Chr1g0038361 [Arabidopsis thaliana]